jgi:hypothetical protein
MKELIKRIKHLDKEKKKADDMYKKYHDRYGYLLTISPVPEVFQIKDKGPFFRRGRLYKLEKLTCHDGNFKVLARELNLSCFKQKVVYLDEDFLKRLTPLTSALTIEKAINDHVEDIRGWVLEWYPEK